jgi:hypothetical protein
MNHTGKTHFFLLCLPKHFSVRTVFYVIKNGSLNVYLPPLKRTQMVLCEPEDRQDSEGYGLNYWGNRGLIPVEGTPRSVPTSFGGPSYVLSNENWGSSPSDEVAAT